MKFSVNQTYEVVTPESAEHGDFESAGFDFEDQDFDLRDLVEYIKDKGFYNDGGSDWLSTADSEQNYQTGAETSRNLHITASPRNLERIYKLAGL